MKRTKQRKLLAVLLAITMLMMTMLPTVVFAEDSGSQYTITDAEELKSIVSQVNAGNNFEGKTIYIQSDIDLNPGYAFEFDEDSGLVAVKYENKIVFYIGTAYQQKVPTGLSSYAMAGNYYTYNGDSYISIDNNNVSKDGDTVTISVGESSYTLSLWKPMGTFSEQENDAKAFAGILDGQGHTISGLFISDSSAQYQGLIGYSTGVIENITLSNSFIYCGQSSGSCVGYNSGTIKNCTNNGTITGFIGGAVHGGICGENYGTVTQCINNGLISTDYNGSGGNQAGGIAGVNYAIVSSSINYGAVWCGAAHVGGIVGYNCDEIKDCENHGAIGSSHNQVGGIAGNNNAWQDYVPQIKSCTNYGTVAITHTKTVATAGNNIGGIAGASTGRGVLIENCSNQGTVEGSSYVGGIVGKLDGSTVENCPNSGEVTGDQYIGGIIGSMFSTTVTNTVKECINKGQVQSSTSNDGIRIGGIVGEKRSDSPDINVLSDCYYLIETISYTKKNSYGVCLSVNDGTITSDSIIQNTFPIFIKEGYKFDGWYEDASFTGEAVTTPEAGKTYYAKWTERVDQSISYENATVEKHINNGTFTNELTKDTVDGAITYTSSNTDVATVNETTGEVTIKGAGTATITATAAETDTHNEAVAAYTLTVTDHSFTNYISNNDATYDKDGTETAVCDVDGCEEAHTRTAQGSMLVDTTAPTGEIKVKENGWKSFINTITFGIFCKDKYDVTITAEDNETGVKSIEYLLSETEISEDDIASADGWQEYSAFSLENEGKYIIYAKITDNKGNVTYISSDGLVIDKTAPAVSGMEDGKTYCSAVEVTVSDEYLNGVTVNGTATPVTEGKFTVEPKDGVQTIVVADKAGNEVTYTITVNDGHTFTNYNSNNDATCTEDGTKTAKCDFCDAKDTLTDAGTKTEHDWAETTYAWSEDGKSCTATHVCSNDDSHTETAQATITSEQTKAPSCTEMGETTYTATFDADWTSQQTKAVIDIPAAGHSYTEVVTPPTCTEQGYTTHTCSKCGDTYKDTYVDATDHSFTNYVSNKDATCTEDGTKTAACDHGCGETDTIEDAGSAKGHSFGEWEIVNSPNCTDKGSKKRTCSECGTIETKDVDPNGHDWEDDFTIDKTATCTTDGSKSIHCKNCEVTKDSTVIPATGHSYGDSWKFDETNHWHECECGEKSSELAHTFEWVTDKETTETENGSKHEECSVCGYKKAAVEIPATGTGGDNDKPSEPSKPDTDAPQTGDSSNMLLWFALLAVSAAGIGTTLVISKKRGEHAKTR